MISAINSVNSSPAFGNHVVHVLRPVKQGMTKVVDEVLPKLPEKAEYLGVSKFGVPEEVAKHFVGDENAVYHIFSYPVEKITKADRDFLHSLGQVFITRA